MTEKKMKRRSYSHILKNNIDVIPRHIIDGSNEFVKVLNTLGLFNFIDEEDYKREIKRLRHSIQQGRRQGWLTRPEAKKGKYILIKNKIS